MRKRIGAVVVAAVVAASSAANAATQQWGQQGDVPVPRDFDGDGRADYVVWRPSTGVWWVLGSVSGAVRTQQWGQQGDIPVPGDYDGDGRVDFVVWRPSTGTWFVMNGVTGAMRAEQWGTNGDIPVPGDYDGDGRLEFAVWRPSTAQWFMKNVDTGVTRVVMFGQSGDKPVPGDYDGIRGDDFSVRTPWNGLWQSMGGVSLRLGPASWLGDVNDVPSTARFCAATVPRTVFRFGQWITSAQPSALVGQAGDIPVAANFTGSWVDDYAAWRPSTGTWITQASTCDHWTASRDRMARATERVRGIAVVAVKNNAIVFAEGAGMANQTTPASADIPWQVGSISKLFIGTTLLTVIDDGLLTFDSSTGLRNPFNGLGTTVRDHVTHTSSLGSGCYSIGNFHPSSNLAQELGCVRSQFQPRPPGSQAEYRISARHGAPDCSRRPTASTSIRTRAPTSSPRYRCRTPDGSSPTSAISRPRSGTRTTRPPTIWVSRRIPWATCARRHAISGSS